MTTASKTIDVTGLQRVSTQYDPILRTLPYRDLKPRLAEMRFRFISSSKELKESTFERKGGISKPYSKGDEDVVANKGLGRIKQATLTPEWGFTPLVEDIMNYEDVNVVGNAPENVDPETKKHPLELQIIGAAVKTVNEDILDALYFAKRDEDDKSPLGLFNGINTIIDELISAGEISTAKGNQVASGTIVAPVAGDTVAYDRTADWLRQASQSLRGGLVIWKLTETAYFCIKDALKNKLQFQGIITRDMVVEALKNDCNIPNLVMSIEPEMGTGKRMMLVTPDLFDFSLWTEGSSSFCQIRNPFPNPNLVQYWMQWKAGTRVRGWNPKVLMINDQTAIANALSGDYQES